MLPSNLLLLKLSRVVVEIVFLELSLGQIPLLLDVFSEFLAAIALAFAADALRAAACSEALVLATSLLISSTFFRIASATSARSA